jgi:hypothetical protein
VDIIVRIGYYAGTAAFLGLALLIPLYLSQRRDVQRLRLWSEWAPSAPQEAEHVAATSVRLAHEGAFTEAAAQAATDRAERRAARGAGDPAAATPAQRVAAERPARSRITSEQMAIYHEPRWRTWLRRGPTTRELLLVMGGAFLLGVVIVAGTQILLSNDANPDVGSSTAGGTGILKEDVEVAVLNGTAVPGLAAAVADDVEANGYLLGAVTNSPTPASQTVVLYERGHEEDARFVAKDLGVDVVQLIDDESRGLAEGADVVVVAGEDRAQA